MDLSYFNDPETGEMKQRPRSKSYADVVRVIEKHKGNNDTVVDTFVASYLDGLQWEWLEEYQAWELSYAEISEWNSLNAGNVSHTETRRVVSGDGDDATVELVEVDVLHEVKELPVAPTRPPLATVEEWKLSNYSILREAAYPSQTDQLAMQYDDAVNSTSTWLDSQTAIKEQYPK